MPKWKVQALRLYYLDKIGNTPIVVLYCQMAIISVHCPVFKPLYGGIFHKFPNKIRFSQKIAPRIIGKRGTILKIVVNIVDHLNAIKDIYVNR